MSDDNAVIIMNPSAIATPADEQTNADYNRLRDLLVANPTADEFKKNVLLGGSPKFLVLFENDEGIGVIGGISFMAMLAARYYLGEYLQQAAEQMGREPDKMEIN